MIRQVCHTLHITEFTVKDHWSSCAALVYSTSTYLIVTNVNNVGTYYVFQGFFCFFFVFLPTRLIPVGLVGVYLVSVGIECPSLGLVVMVLLIIPAKHNR